MSSRRRWFRSDDHFGHENIIDFANRPWDNADEMNEALIATHNAEVRPGDDVYYLGDSAWGIQRVPILSRLNGNVKLVPGNHDSCHPMYPKAKRDRKVFEDAGVEVLDPQVTIQMMGLDVLLCHFPYFGVGKGHGKDDRYSGNRPDDVGGWLLCGHVHGAWLQRGRMINVGVDVWDYQPVPEEWIGAMILSSPEGRSNVEV